MKKHKVIRARADRGMNVLSTQLHRLAEVADIVTTQDDREATIIITVRHNSSAILDFLVPFQRVTFYQLCNKSYLCYLSQRRNSHAKIFSNDR